MNDPAPILDYRGPQQRRPRARRIRSFGEEILKVAWLATVFIVYGSIGNPEKGADLFGLAALILWMGIGVALIVRRGRPRAHRMGTALKAQIWFLLIGSISLMAVTMLANGYSCPHGTRWANNYLGIAHSSTSGPCRNGQYQPVGKAWHVAGDWYVYFLPANRW